MNHLPLAKSLLSKGYELKGSTTSKGKLDVLKNAGILTFQIQLEAQQIIGTIEDFLKETNVLIIDIPPGLRRERCISSPSSRSNDPGAIWGEGTTHTRDELASRSVYSEWSPIS